MIKSRSTLPIQPCRPRRIWLNAVGSQNGAAREEELRRSLPFCDLETGTKNRVVQRDPITGLGLLGREFDPLQECRMRSRSAKDRASEDRNPILGEGDLGGESNGFRRQYSVRGSGGGGGREYRNPIDLSSDSNEPDLDALRPNNRPAKTIVQQVSRDPISGRGDFGNREWDPIRKFSGRPKPPPPPQQPPTQPKEDRRGRNPLTGEDMTAATDRTSATGTPRRVIKKANPLTGENCNSFSVKPEERKQRERAASNSSRGSNPLTGEGCQTSDSRPSTPRKSANGNGGNGGGNPLTGDSGASFDLSADFRSKAPSDKGDAKNPLTGENCQSYDLSSESRPRPVAPVKEDRPNPLTGENLSSFDINQELRSGKAMPAAVVAAEGVAPGDGGDTGDVTGGSADVMPPESAGNQSGAEGGNGAGDASDY